MKIFYPGTFKSAIKKLFKTALIKCIVLFIGVLAFSMALKAQVPTLSYASSQTYTVGTPITTLNPTISGAAIAGYSGTVKAAGSGFVNPTGVTVDAAGNIYVADYGGNVVKEIIAGSGTIVTLGAGFSRPWDIKVDAAGNVYVSNTGDNTVKEIVKSSGAVLTIGSGFSFPAGIALDAAGDVYVCDSNNNLIKKIAAGFTAPPVSIGDTFNDPFGIAVDPNGNIFVADISENITEIPFGGGNPTIVVSGLNNPNGLITDAAGNLYVLDTGKLQLKELLAGTTTVVPLNYTFSVPYDVALDPSGNLYVADYGVTSIDKFSPTGGFYIYPNLPAGLVFSNSTGYISGTATVSSPATNYTATAWNASGNSAPATLNIQVNLPSAPTISYPTPPAYTTGTTISPLVASKTGVAQTGYSRYPISVGSGFSEPAGTAEDAKGDIYVADVGASQVRYIPAGGGGPFTIAANSFFNPTDVALDAAGNLYVCDQLNNAIKEVKAGTNTAITLGFGFSHPFGVAVDNMGNVYVGDQGDGEVKKIPAGGGIPIILASGLSDPDGVCVDPAGNVYVADIGHNAIKKIPAAGGPPVSVGKGFVEPASGAVDASGDLFVADRDNNSVYEILAGSDSTMVIGSGFYAPLGISVDQSGNVWVGDSGHAQLKELKPVGGFYVNPALPAGLALSITTGNITGTPTTLSPLTTYTITDYNAGGNASTKVSIQVVAPGSTTLSNLSVGSGTLAPAFASNTINYSAFVSNTTTSITVTPLATTSTSTITVNGTAVESGIASAAIPLAISANTITIVVTAQGGTASQAYTLTVTRAAGTNANLSALVLGGATLSPAFASGTTSYTASVSNATTSVTVTPSISAPTATVTVNGTAVTSGSPSGAIALNVGVNTITTIVTAQDGVTMGTYTITVTRKTSSNDATLSNLTISSGTLSPTFAAGTTSYTDVAHAVSSIAFRATTTDALATETINGTAVPEGTVSPYIPLSVGVNNVNVVVTAQDGVTKDTYTIAVTRLPGVATLTKLTISSGTLSPAFATATTSYTDVAHAVSSIAFRATTTDALATETINGTAVPEGTVSSYIPLSVGVNNVSVVVTAQDGVTKDTYTIAVTRLPGVATLSKLTISSGILSPAFAIGTTSYTDNVATTVSSIAFRATTTDALATETINGTAVAEGTVSPYIPLNAGVNNISVVITAQDGVTTETYTIAVTRAASSNIATLSNVTISNGTLTPAFAAGTTSYTDVAHSVTSIAFRATTTDPLATETINGTAVPEGTVSPYIPLNAGVNNISIVVTAQDGVTQDTYTIAVTRLPNVATLSKLTVSNGTLSPAFATATTSYSDNVANTVSSIAFRATTTDHLATETINGTTVPEGTVSSYFPLNVGVNNISVVATAQDGVSTETYTIAVTRAAPPVADAVYQSISVETTAETPRLEDDVVIVHQGVSPNGDGVDDFLQIDNITNYPDNRLAIMNRNGMLVYEAKGYDNASRVFDGHSNKNGAMQLPGTYFYELDYTVNGINKHKTGFLVLKY
jgi:gliding motility-associated-like protein